jgi:hypothetical protein
VECPHCGPTKVAKRLMAPAIPKKGRPARNAKAEAPPAPVAEVTKVEAVTDAPLVQIAVLLDTSGSMQGLIEQAKTQLWKLVNEFITAKQDGKTPVVQVALYEYGKSSLRSEDHWIRQIQPLTRDLDKVSEELFALTTNGGDEYCGAVIQRATLDLAWDANPKVYKAIFIAGNERWHFDLQIFVTRNFNNWSYFTSCIKHNVAGFLSACQIDFRCSDDVEIMFAHRECQRSRNCVFDGL